MCNTNEQNLTISTIKRMLSAPLFLTAAIGYSVYGIFQLLVGLMSNPAAEDMIYEIADMQDSLSYEAFVDSYVMVYNFMKVFMIIIGMIPVVLIIAGLWMLFVSAKSNQQSGIRTTGLTMIRVVVVIQLVCGVILMMLAMFAGFGIMALGEAVAIVVGITVLIVGDGILAISFIYFLKLNATIKRMRDTILTGVPDDRISMYVIVCCFLMGGIKILMALASLVSLSLMGVLAQAGTATADIAFAIYLLQYKKNMSRLIEKPTVTDIYHSGGGGIC